MAKQRRDSGDGSIYQRKSDGRWCASVSLGNVGGIVKRRTVYGNTRKEVRAKLDELRRAVAAGQQVGTDREAVAQYLEHWLDDVVRRRVRPTTFQSYRGTVTNHLAPALGHLRLAKLTSVHVQRLLNDLTDQGRAQSSVTMIRTLLHNALEHARIKERRILENVVDATEVPRQRAREHIEIDIHLAQRILEATAQSPVAMEVAVGLTLGLRSGEVRGLQWRDVDLEDGTLTVRQTAQYINRMFVLGEPKTDASRRTIPIPPALLDRLREHRVKQMETRLRAGPLWTDLDLVFPGTLGSIRLPDTLRFTMHRALVAAGLPAIRFHDLRHGCGSILAAMGVEPRVAMEILGHTDPAFTLRMYTKALRENKREATNSIDRVLQFNKVS